MRGTHSSSGNKARRAWKGSWSRASASGQERKEFGRGSVAARKARFSAGLTDWSTLEAAHPAKFDIGQRGGRQANPCALPLARGGARAEAFAKPLSPSLCLVTLLTCSLNRSLPPCPRSFFSLYPRSHPPPTRIPPHERNLGGGEAFAQFGSQYLASSSSPPFFFSFCFLFSFFFFFFLFLPFLRRFSQARESANLNPPLHRAHVQPTTHRITFPTNPLQRWNETMDTRVQPRENRFSLCSNEPLFFPIIFPPSSRYRQCPGYPIHRMFSCNNNPKPGWRYPQDWKRVFLEGTECVEGEGREREGGGGKK